MPAAAAPPPPPLPKPLPPPRAPLVLACIGLESTNGEEEKEAGEEAKGSEGGSDGTEASCNLRKVSDCSRAMRSKPEFSERTVPSIIAKRPAVALPAVDDDEEDDDEPEPEEVAPVVTEICCCCCRDDKVNDGERGEANCDCADSNSTVLLYQQFAVTAQWPP